MKPTESTHADIGHVHLRVADLDRAVGFYRDLIGLEVRNEIDGAAFLAFGGYHHHLALNTWSSEGGGPPAAGTTGLHHFAIRFGRRRDLAAAAKRLLDAGVAIDSSSDCGGIADSIYVRDPDGNGLELTWDRPPDRRPDPLPATDRPLDLGDVLGELD